MTEASIGLLLTRPSSYPIYCDYSNPITVYSQGLKSVFEETKWQ